MKRLLLVLLMVLAAPLSAIAAGSCTYSVAYEEPNRSNSPYSATWTCTADASGNVSDPTITGDGKEAPHYGMIYRATLTPGAGADQPTDLYDVELRKSGTTVDMLGGLGANLSNATPRVDMPVTATNALPVRLFADALVPYASGVGNAKKFTLSVLVVR
ncbi:MAG: hypothetical protein ACLGPL_06780 [Acidobacteriota bacterium]